MEPEEDDTPAIDMDLDDAPPLPPTSAVKGSSSKADAKQAAAKKGGSTWVLWILLLTFLVMALGAATYLLQEKLVEYWPVTEDYLIMAHFRHERPGAGFELKRVGDPERGVHDNVEVMVFRGIILNTTDRTLAVPPLKLMMLDKDGHSVQEKIDNPPVNSLDPHGSASYKIVVERPDPNARSMKLVFIEAPSSAVPEPAHEAEPPASAPTGSMTPPPAPASAPMITPPPMEPAHKEK